MELLLAIIIGALFAGGIYMLLRRSIVKLVVGLILLGHGANLLIFLMGRLTPGQTPLVPAGATQPSVPFADPLPQALVLTAIVIGVAVLALALSLAIRLYHHYGVLDLRQIKEQRW